MLIVKIIFCISTLIVILMAGDYNSVNYGLRGYTIKKVAITTFAIAFAIGFCILLIVTKWNVFTIAKICLFITACLFVYDFRYVSDVINVIAKTCLVITVVAYIVGGINWFKNIERVETPDVQIISSNIICAKDDSVNSGSGFGVIMTVYTSSEKSVYKYYYQLEDGGFKQGSIPAESTTIYYIEDGEEPRLDTVITTTYSINTNNNPPTRCNERSRKTYKLYVPQGSIMNVYEFDAE